MCFSSQPHPLIEVGKKSGGGASKLIIIPWAGLLHRGLKAILNDQRATKPQSLGCS